LTLESASGPFVHGSHALLFRLKVLPRSFGRS
jgi:hypothetical protein